jgi:succinyl-diaminopimelate desuccinylase
LSGAADPLPLAQALIACPSVTPADAGAQDVLAAFLETLGFAVERLRFGETENLFARIGTGGPHLCFAGHTDVVPPGEAGWTAPPFAGAVRDGVLYGRGACDMKGGIAAFAAACADRLGTPGAARGTISLLITGDEEGPATDGTVRVLDWMRARGTVPDFCIVGEPTCRATLGDTVKIGRRGSLNARLTVSGTQGHVAYPARADNPVHRMVALLSALIAEPLDAGTRWFEPSSLQLTSIDVGNPATNVIPAEARASLNIRFNDRHTGASLTTWLRETAAAHAPRAAVDVSVSGEAFLTEPGPLVEAACAAIERATGVRPALDTGGGTSDARFITRLCPVMEFGGVGSTMHQVDERVPVAELRALARTYRAMIDALLDGDAR